MMNNSNNSSQSAGSNLEITDEAQIDTSAIRQENGQRKYGGPPPGWEGPPPSRGSEIFIGKLPRYVFEDRLLPVLASAGRVYEMRLMVDFSSTNRGFCFATYATPDEARNAVRLLNNFEILPGKHIGVVKSVDNRRIFVGGIPKQRSREDVKVEMAKLTEELVDVILYQSQTDKSKNRGFAFVEYETHKAAAMARKKLQSGHVQLWGEAICAEWAEPEQEVDEDTMSRVKKLYVRNLMLSTTEESIRNMFEAVKPGCIEKVKKLKDFAFVHFTSREDTLEAMEKTNGTLLDGAKLEVVLAKPRDTSYMRYVKNAQRIQQQQDHHDVTTAAAAFGQLPPGVAVQQSILTAAANKLYAVANHQKHLGGLPGDLLSSTGSSTPHSPASLITNGGGDPMIWAYTGTPMFDPGYAAYQHALATAERARLPRGAAGMRAAGFQAYVNSQIKRNKRRFADAALLNELGVSPNGVVGGVVGSPFIHGIVGPPTPHAPTTGMSPLSVISTTAGYPHPSPYLFLNAGGGNTAPTQLTPAVAMTPTNIAGFLPFTVGNPAAATAAALGGDNRIYGWTEQLDQCCMKLGLGVPVYEQLAFATKDAANRDIHFYIYKVKIPGLPDISFQTPQPSPNADEAKDGAAMAAAIQLGVAAVVQPPVVVAPYATTTPGAHPALPHTVNGV